ncbi:hypothetical protein [Coxiella burnetii]|uniref:Uncharacterized protein n=2 Tax=Coxiella burnetii TaxID=777 RepID=Q83DD8_COXBU|nr:hypothetical protein [Coxiella burnetii]NP_819820.1 hypothetical protein CBU_0800 [Coxiella burnetii RSA 493]AAO90334.1 hypothetical protein CBU_0800 [Coxiella burnetii RSA 493]ABS77821.2 hypothetical protein CBUD_0867 [Coxiella burnetii Dugway 5J108-111]ARI65635.1 hypothetical protein B7L74_04080 [Coxiella burnetii]AZV75720.1 hypothetical protein D6219_07965 [Coxiella burnetii]MCF2093712.1 hypothetical protein [Coxiella burnetii]
MNMNHYLQLMGIDVWRLRTPVSNHYYHYDLLDTQDRQVGVLLADAVLKDEKESQLVEKIAKATKKQIRGGLKEGRPNPEKLGQCVIILLGNRVTQSFSQVNFPQIITSHSPAELLRDGDLKPKTWNALKKAMQLMEA